MPKPNATSPLVVAATAIDEELREYDELAREAKRVEFDGEKALTRATRILQEATTRQPRIQEKLRALVGEIQAAQARQQQSLDVLVEVSRGLATRAAEFEALMTRFAALGESAKAVNQLTSQLSARRNDGAPDTELLEGLRSLEERISAVVVDAEGLARDAKQSSWPEIALQAEAIRQQVCAAKNKLALAQRTVSERAPS
jgi:transcriptional regulator NrdR family protein